MTQPLMHTYLSLNGKLLETVEAGSAASQAALYGKGLFSTIAIFGGIPFLWDKHWRRLTRNASKIGIDVSGFTEADVLTALHELIVGNELVNGRCRITFLDESFSPLWPTATQDRTTLLLTTAAQRPATGDLSVGVSPYPINTGSPIAGVKSCNYLEKILAIDKARQDGFDEAIQLNERGEIVSAVMANVFWTREGKLFTPSLETSCLPGTTREFVLENLDCEETVAAIGELDSAEDVLLTSAGIGVAQAVRFRDRPLAGKRHPILELLSAVG